MEENILLYDAELSESDATASDRYNSDILEEEVEEPGEDVLTSPSSSAEIEEVDNFENEIDYTEQIERIIENEDRILELLERTQDNAVSDSDVVNNDDSNQIERVVQVSENNILNTPIKDYSIGDQIMLTYFVLVLVIAFTIMIRRAVGKWR